jgi:hypothetical protein
MNGCVFKRKLPSGKIVWGYSIDSAKGETADENRYSSLDSHANWTLISSLPSSSPNEVKVRLSVRTPARLRTSPRHGCPSMRTLAVRPRRLNDTGK